MDAHDIFQKLTRGVHFTKRKAKPLELGANIDIKIAKNSFNDEHFKSDDDDIKPIKENSNMDGGDFSNDEGFQIIDDNSIEPIQKKRKNTLKLNKKLAEQEEINHFRNINHISVNGKNIPHPIRTFNQLQNKIPQRLLDNILGCGYSTPTPVQMQAIPIMLCGRPLMACAKTGSGKTVAFLTPIIRDLGRPQNVGFRAIILCPTRELAKQTQRECLRLAERMGLKVHVISKVKQVEQKFGPESNKKYDILVSTPNRIRFLINQDVPLLDLSNIEWFIIDEADKLMEDGQNSFKEQFEDILAVCTNPNKKLALFSATYTASVSKWAVKNLKGLIRITIGERNSATDMVEQKLLFVGSESGKLLAIRDLVKTGLKPPVLVFVQSKDRAKQLFEELLYDGINVDVIHADRSQQQRDNVVRAFREGKIWVLICTELMGRGIDFKGVNLVINYDFPPTLISYIHRIGRTGRAGRTGKAITYYTQNDTANLRSIAHIIKNSGGQVPDFMLAMKKPKKSEKKHLENHALDREDIRTIPKFVLEKKQQFGNHKNLEKSTKNNSTEHQHTNNKNVKSALNKIKKHIVNEK